MTGKKGQYGGRRILEGTVVSDKTEKTVVVAVKSSVQHPLYRKIVRRVRKFMAHDDQLDAHMGDTVRIVESRPLSKRKRWRVIEVLNRADLPEVAAASIDLELLGEVKVEEEEAPEDLTAPSPATPAGVAEEEPASEPAISSATVEEPPAVEEVTEEALEEDEAEPEPESQEEIKAEEPPAEAETEEQPAAEEPEAEEETK